MDCFEKKKKKWGKKAPGIIAKMVSNLDTGLSSPTFGIHLKKRALKRDYNVLFAIWRPILLAKFQQNEEARKTLLKTGDATLVEKSRFPGESKNFWGGYVGADGRIQGYNLMGKFMMAMRNEFC